MLQATIARHSAGSNGCVNPVQNELCEHADAFTDDPQNAPLGFILSMEGADPVIDPDNIFDWWEDGLRVKKGDRSNSVRHGLCIPAYSLSVARKC